jgi:putative tryptophan/tyrosine transport system substrate-binding protein
MRRREVMALFGGAAVSTVLAPCTVRAQQPALPVIGFLSSRAPDDAPELLAAFLQGLKDADFVEGQNVTIEYRFAGNHNERLPALAADLVHRQVNVIAAPTTPAALAAKAATATIPIVVATAGDPVQLGLVASLNRPGGNLTGVTLLFVEVAAKRLELLHELIPTASVIGMLVNPANPPIAEANASAVLSAAHSLGLELHVLKASTDRDFDGVFANLIQLRAGGLVIGGDPFFTGRQEQLAALAARHAVPTVYENREFVAAGGLMSYGGNLPDAYRLAAVYATRILKGEKPADLPVQQSTKVELFLNLKTAKALGITAPLSLLGRADEVIE